MEVEDFYLTHNIIIWKLLKLKIITKHLIRVHLFYVQCKGQSAWPCGKITRGKQRSETLPDQLMLPEGSQRV